MSIDNEIVYREAEVADAQEMVDFYNRVGGETTYLSFEENEYPLDVEAQKASIESTKKQANAVMLLATAGGTIVGLGTISSNMKVKAKHCGELGIVVTKEYQGRGIGSEIIRRLLEWSRNNGVTTRVQLDTRTDNEKAVELYKKFGFEIEGQLKNTTLIDGEYYDLYIMGLML